MIATSLCSSWQSVIRAAAFRSAVSLRILVLSLVIAVVPLSYKVLYILVQPRTVLVETDSDVLFWWVLYRLLFYGSYATIQRMTARTHDVAAATVLLLAVLANPPESLRLSTLLLAILANQVGGITPDIDQPTAPLWRNLPEGHVIGKVFGKMLGGHRFISHSLIGMALFGWLSYLLLHALQPIMPHVDIQLVWYAFLLGYGSHIVMDMLTKEGVPLLLPFTFKFGVPPAKALRITTGTWVETAVVLPVLVICGGWLCWSHANELVGLLHRVIT